MGRIVILLLILVCCLDSFSQQTIDSGVPAYRYQMDYNIPESPAFSVLNANPSSVMRGSASREVIINLATDLLHGSSGVSGLALDFNPYFVFGGRLTSVEEYRKSTIKRLLSNTQLSFASVGNDTYPDDLLLATGLRITLFDTKDPIFDRQLGSDIDDILSGANDGALLFDDFIDNTEEVVNIDFSPVYTASTNRYKNQSGGSMSLGAAVSTRAKNKSLVLDSLLQDKFQMWLSGQYDFGVSGLSMTGMLMIETLATIEDRNTGTIGGLAVRQYRKDMIINAELTYNSIFRSFEAGGLVEYYKFDDIILYAAFSYDRDEITGSYQSVFRPGIKWDISQ